MNVTVVGTGRMARKMVEAMMTFPELTLHSVVSRTQQKAYLFASEFGFEKSFSSLESALEDEQVDLVYIATPHSEHFGQMLQCIEHRKPVLCEKSFTLNSRQAQTVIDAASSAKVFLCEALWNRFLPSRFALDGVLERNLIGEISMVSASLCYSLTHKSRLSDPALGGGALLDVGIYPLSFAASVFGLEVIDVSTVATLTERGVDAQESMTLIYEGNKMAVLSASMLSKSDCRGLVCGSEGCIVVDNVNCCRSIKAFDNWGNEIWAWNDPAPEVSGLHYELRSVVDAVKTERLECEEVPNSETLEMMRIMDRLRKEWGLVFPGE